MNKAKIFLTTLAAVILGCSSVHAASLDSLIRKSDLDKTATIAVSVKDVKSGHVVYEYNEHKYMNPASVLKIFTMKSAYFELGKDYTFQTAVYADSKNNLYIKLGSDPSLSTDSLKTLITNVKENYKKPVQDIIIDSTIIDNKQWGTGWMWDDDTNSLLPKYSPYSINENKIELTITPQKNGRQPEIKNKSCYPMQVVNLLKYGDSNSITLERAPWISGDLTYVTGSIKAPAHIVLPVASPQRHFISVLNSVLNSSGIKYKGTIKFAPVPSNAAKIASISSDNLSNLIGNTLKNSNNFYSEMIFKAAGGHYTKSQGTTQNAIDMFNSYFSSLKSDKPAIADACGISRNDLITADWTTSALNKIYKENSSEDFISLMPKPIEGTLSDRLLNISLKLRAKTGTASGISSIAGYIDTKSNKKYSFAIFIQNHTSSVLDVKKFEDQLINEIYKM